MDSVCTCRGAPHIAQTSAGCTGRALAVVKWNLLNFLRQIHQSYPRSERRRNEPPLHILRIFMGGTAGKAMGVGWRGGAREKASSEVGNQSQKYHLYASILTCPNCVWTGLQAVTPFIPIAKQTPFDYRVKSVPCCIGDVLPHQPRYQIIHCQCHTPKKTRAFCSCRAA